MATDWKQQYFRYQKYFLNIMALYKRRSDIKAFLEILLSLGAIALFGAFALKPTILTIIDLTRDIRTKRQTVADMKTKITALGTAQTLYQNQSQRLSLLDSAVPNSPATAEIVRQIEGAAQVSQASVLGIASEEVALSGPQPATDSDRAPLPGSSYPLTLTISAAGSYESLISLLKTIESLRRPARANILALTLTDSGEESTIVMTVTVQFPFLPQPETQNP